MGLSQMTDLKVNFQSFWDPPGKMLRIDVKDDVQVSAWEPALCEQAMERKCGSSSQKGAASQ